MAAYASYQRDRSRHVRPSQPAALQLLTGTSQDRGPETAIRDVPGQEGPSAAIIDQFVDRLAERIAVALAERLTTDDQRVDDWLDSRHAAEYLGVHRDTLRKLAAERAIPSEQDGPGCKLYFQRADLDAWRRGGGRPRHLATVVASAA